MKPSPSLLPVFQCLCSIFRVEPDPWRALRLSASFGPSRLFYLSDAVPHSALLLSRFTRVRLCAALWTAAQQAPPSLGFSRQDPWSGLPLPSLFTHYTPAKSLSVSCSPQIFFWCLWAFLQENFLQGAFPHPLISPDCYSVSTSQF